MSSIPNRNGNLFEIIKSRLGQIFKNEEKLKHECAFE